MLIVLILFAVFLLVFTYLFTKAFISDSPYLNSSPRWFWVDDEHPASNEILHIYGSAYKCWHISEQGLDYVYCGQGDGRDAWVRIGVISKSGGVYD